MLEDWAALGIGAAILPRSKMSAKDHAAVPVSDKAGQRALIGFEAAWLRERGSADHLIEFSRHLETIVPSIVAGIEIGSS